MLTFKSNIIKCLLLLVIGVSAANATSLLHVRFGSHQGYDRMVCELSNTAKYQVVHAKDGAVELHLDNVSVGEKFFLPKLPSQIKLLTSVEAFQEGEHNIVIEVRGSEAMFAKTTELRGTSWRLAIDLSKLSEQPVSPANTETVPANPETTSTTKPYLKNWQAKDEPVPYVPGDKPIETILADNPKQNSEPELVHEELPAKISEESPQPEHNLEAASVQMFVSDSLKALETLAQFYGVVGDQQSASDYARLYLDMINGSESSSRKQAGHNAAWPNWILAAIAFAAGIVGGIIGNRLRMPKLKIGIPELKLPSFKFPKREKTKDKFDELVHDLDKLDHAVASEKHKTALKPQLKASAFKVEVPEEVVKEAEQDFPEDVKANVESDMKESLMDRRVKRVMELTAQERSLADIAKELDMGQDEVKLIIDLNS